MYVFTNFDLKWPFLREFRVQMFSMQNLTCETIKGLKGNDWASTPHVLIGLGTLMQNKKWCKHKTTKACSATIKTAKTSRCNILRAQRLGMVQIIDYIVIDLRVQKEVARAVANVNVWQKKS